MGMLLRPCVGKRRERPVTGLRMHQREVAMRACPMA